MKKILIGIGILLFLLIGIWFFLFRNQTDNQELNNQIDNQENLFPFGQGNTIPGKPNQPGTSTTVSVDQNNTKKDYLPLLRKIWDKPITGGVVFDQDTSTKIRFIEKSTGHIYETEKNLPTTIRLSNTTIPRIQETIWQNNGNKVLMRYLREDNETIRTFSAIIPTSTDSAIDGIFFKDNVLSPVIFKDKVAYIEESVNGTTVITSDLDGTKKKALFTSPANEWMISWTNPTTLTLWSAPSVSTPGVIYTLDINNGVYNRVLSEVYGGEGKLNKDGSLMLVTGSLKKGIGSVVVNTKTGDRKILPVSTLVNKCAWSNSATSTIYCAVPNTIPTGEYPDEWYQGKISFNDSMWRIDTVSGSTERLFDPQITEGEVSMDIMDVAINDKNDTLLFKNKKDQTLWSYDIY